jgi:hypothetical protein
MKRDKDIDKISGNQRFATGPELDKLITERILWTNSGNVHLKSQYRND